jgi:UDP-N-acetylmuramoyl-L-alanyl-D-glutamate--2,6-diaminopimelate ligase
MAACPTGIEIGDRRSAIFEGVSMLRAGDALVIAGKGHEEGQIVGEVTHPFSDHSVAREALASGASRR